MSAPTTDERSADEARSVRIADKLNWLRAAALGASDGLISTAAMVIGVAGAAVSNARHV